MNKILCNFKTALSVVPFSGWALWGFFGFWFFFQLVGLLVDFFMYILREIKYPK